jgi:hypothetical protein
VNQTCQIIDPLRISEIAQTQLDSWNIHRISFISVCKAIF